MEIQETWEYILYNEWFGGYLFNSDPFVRGRKGVWVVDAARKEEGAI